MDDCALDNIVPKEDRVFVIMDTPNAKHSAARAADYENPNEDARLSFKNIVADIDRYVPPGFTSRCVVKRVAVDFEQEDVAFKLKMKNVLERAGFQVVTVAKKYFPPTRLSLHRAGGRSRRSDRPRQPGESETTSSPYRDDEGIVDRELINHVWNEYVRSLNSGRPLTTIVIISGDGDFMNTVQMLRAYGVRVEVYGPRGATSPRLKTRVDRLVIMSQDEPADLPERERFIFFETRDRDGGRVSEECQLADEATNPMYDTSVTGEFERAQVLGAS